MDLKPGPPASGGQSHENEGSVIKNPPESVFFGPQGLRVAWRLPIALSLWFVVSGVLQTLLFLIPGTRAWLHAQTASGTASPRLILFLEGPNLAATLATMLMMTKIEGRSFSDYYLPGKDAFGRHFWQGFPFGFLMLSLLMASISVAHGFSFGTLALGAGEAVKFGLLYLAGFILVALFEEASFRGYLQSTLQLAMGFWPAALVLAAFFGAIHLGNTSEARYGAFMAGCFGLFAAFVLRRTGNLWFVIGIHTAWDWGETFFYSAPDSGILASGHLMNSTLQGPLWLTGGASGPEASAFSLLVLALAALVIHMLFPAKPQKDLSSTTEETSRG
jgi:uncharacterized protein